MPSPSSDPPRRPSRARPARAAKRPMTFRLSEQTLAAAQRILGTPNATATIEAALDLVVFRQELIDGTDAMFGIEIASLDDER